MVTDINEETGLQTVDQIVARSGDALFCTHDVASEEQWNRLFSIDVTGVFLGSKHVVPYLVKRGGGSIMNVSSVAGLRGARDHVLYGASKGAVMTMTKDLAAELASKIRINSVHHPYIKTAMAEFVVDRDSTSVISLGTYCRQRQGVMPTSCQESVPSK